MGRRTGAPSGRWMAAVVLLSSTAILTALGAMVPSAFYDQTKYEVVMVEEPQGPIPEGPNSVMMTSREGQRYSCEIPVDQVAATNEAKLQRRSALQARKVASEVDRLLAPLRGKCFYKTEGWWSYEFCYRKHLRQFHSDEPNQPPVAEFMLGSRLGKVDESYLTSSIRADRPYFPEKYINGTECDIASGQRSVEVQFRCVENGQPGIGDIKEPASCQYVVSFHTPHVCNAEHLVPMKQDTHTIRCYRAVGGSEGWFAQAVCDSKGGCEQAVDLSADPRKKTQVRLAQPA